MNIKIKKSFAYSVDIFIGGNYEDAIRSCKKFTESGLCVTLERIDFVYTKGHETGIKIGVKNYPRFEANEKAIWATAELLASTLMFDLYQRSAMLCDHKKHVWLSLDV